MIPREDFVRALTVDGAYIAHEVFTPGFVTRAKASLEAAIAEEVRYHGSTDFADYGQVLLCARYGGAFLEMLQNEELLTAFEWVLGPGCIVYANSSTSMPPQGTNFGCRIHVDSPRVIPGYTSSLAAIVLLDEFTPENGATWYLPGSQERLAAPSDEHFFAHARRLLAPAGSVFFFNPRVWHTGVRNGTDRWRHALTVVMCRPYMKQRVDIPRMLAHLDHASWPERLRQKLGFLAQVPASYEEYYAPPGSRKFRQAAE